MDINKVVGENVLSARKEVKITQEELAAQSNISVSMVSMIERGLRQPSLDVLMGLSKALNLPMSDLLPGADGEEDPHRALVSFARRKKLTKEDVQRLIEMGKTLFQDK